MNVKKGLEYKGGHIIVNLKTVNFKYYVSWSIKTTLVDEPIL